jgi:chorismate dehydratase
MKFGAINYLNLLPFYVFMKQHLKTNSEKKKLFFKKGVPSKINSFYKNKRVDGAFISSIRSRNEKNCSNLGIIAKKDVLSVIVINGTSQQDSESETSNKLATILNKKGKVLIGDKALKFCLENKNNNLIKFEDLAVIWNQKYKLPFVFARLCFNKQNNYYFDILLSKFANSKIKVPFYILKSEAKRLNISVSEVKLYLSKISYKIDKKSEKSLSLFLKKSKRD